jgi:hypothetical protein
MKLSAYIVRVDCGFAPNPFGDHCTLACCKPTIRRNAERDDIIVGTAASHFPYAGCLIYAMRVGKVLPYQQYWDDPTYAYRKPSFTTPISRRGDNIWHRDASGEWQVIPGAIHDHSHRDRDTRGENALIAVEFFYFGRDAISVHPEFSGLLATTQGHKNTYDPDMISRFWDWLRRTTTKSGLIGDPSDFTDQGCRAQCWETEDDTEDVETPTKMR